MEIKKERKVIFPFVFLSLIRNFVCRKRKLYEKTNNYFNDVLVDKLVPITKYGLYEFDNYYFDKENQKLYIFKNNIYKEIEPHTNHNKFYVQDKDGKKTSFNLKKLNSLMK